MRINLKSKFGSSFVSLLALVFTAITFPALFAAHVSASTIYAFTFFGSMLPLSLFYMVKAFRKKAQPTSDPTDVRIFRRSRTEVLCLAIGAAGFTAGCYGFVSGDATGSGAAHSWLLTFGAVFFGAGLIIFSAMLIAGSPRLVLSPDGLQARFLRIQLIPWCEIEGAISGRFISQEYVALHIRQEDKYLNQMPRRFRFGAAAGGKLGIPPFSLMPDMFGTTKEDMIAEIKARIAKYGTKLKETE
jgi:hypothetical protein